MERISRTAELKVERIGKGGRLRVLELCSGCGGMSLGLHAAGFDLAAHIENDALANETHALNFSPQDEKLRKVWETPRDMLSTSLPDVVTQFGIAGKVERAFDVVAAGLPCQAFARIGRPKLRSVTGDDHAYRNDPRAMLYRRFLRFVEQARPIAIVVENVPDILNFDKQNVPEEICRALDGMGYESRYTLMNAAFYGVPQLRERLFLVAIHSSLNVVPSFPEPTHHVDLPKGYENTRQVALKYVPREGSHYVKAPAASGRRPDAVSVQGALDDLPFLSDHLQPDNVRHRSVIERLPYRDDRVPSVFGKTMRNWPGFATGDDVDGNAIRLTARDFPIFGRMPRGGDYPIALRIANELFQEKLDELDREGCRPATGSVRYAQLRAATIPPYDAGKFPNKWWKLVPEDPSRTLTAHLGRDTYSHIHYDGRQKRTISVREAARLQSFPDGFRFAGGMNASFRQIGNAVPPLLARAIGAELMKTISEAAAARRRAA